MQYMKKYDNVFPSRALSQTEQLPRLKIPAKRDVIGIYGIPGSGKSFILNELRDRLPAKHFSFHEGSFVISQLIDGGLRAFGDLSEPTKTIYRKYAIGSIRDQCINFGSTAVVTGHALFWPEEGQPTDVYTEDDLATFGHIIYLDVPSHVVAQRRADDQERARTCSTVEHLGEWQAREKALLRRLCLDHGILFTALGSSGSNVLSESLEIVRDFRFLTDEQNILQVTERLNRALHNGPVKANTVLLVDGDRTLAAEDTGDLFWRNLATSGHDAGPLKKIFSGPLGYSSDSFRQANRFYEEAGSDDDFHKLCATVASQVTVYPEILTILKQARTCNSVRIIVLTCGLAAVWEKVLERAGFGSIAVLGGGRRADQAVIMTPEVKGSLVRHLQKTHGCKVIAFGDSPLDVPMLARADEAIVVVGHEQTRSHSMEAVLSEAISSGVLHARQCLLPNTVSPRLNTATLPIVDINSTAFLENTFGTSNIQAGSISNKLHCVDSNVANLLMTPTRDAKVFGPALREAHQRVGNLLAISLITAVVGLEEYPIQHVQGHQTTGYRLENEQHVLLVALMRGGEPLAMGVNDAFPLATFVHAKEPSDLLPNHMAEKKVVMLIDSVVNSGKTVAEFLRRVRELHSDVSVLVVAGVVQSGAIDEAGALGRALVHDRNLQVVALRTSDNKFTGSGTTDTGNRLYNTTYIL